MQSRILRHGELYELEVEGGKRLPLYGYMSYQPARARYQDFKQIGVELFFCAVYAGDRGINQNSGTRPFRPGFWKGYGEYDFSHAEHDFKLIIADSKPGEIYLIPRLMIEPPSWWDDANPDELCRDAQGAPVHQSYSSEKWIRDSEEMMAAFQHWIVENGWDKYIPGWHIACGNTEEFLPVQFFAEQKLDYSARSVEAFHRWLEGKYETVEKLNESWHASYASIAEAKLASPAQRMYGSLGALRDPEWEMQAIDTYQFLHESMADAVVRLCEAAKRVTGGNQVIGAFFGYTNCGSEVRHHAMRAVMESDAVDFLASPLNYTDNRAQGIDWPFQGSVASAMLHGKPWFVEADVRTCYSEPLSRCMTFADPYVGRAYDGPVWFGPDTVEGSLGQMKKAFSRVLTHNTAIWWFDMWGGWYNQDQLMDFHKKAREIYFEHSQRGGSPNRAPIAVFIDDELLASLPNGGYQNRLGYQMGKDLGQIGTPYQQYTMDDLALVDPSSFRVAVFMSACHWTDEQLKALENWKKDGRMLVFTGAVDQSAASGIKTLRMPGLEDLPTEAHVLARAKAAPAETHGFDGSLGVKPLRVPVVRFETRPGDVVMETAPDGGAVEVLRRSEDYNVFVSTAVTIPAAKLRELTYAAGGAVYTPDGDCAYASRRFLAIHAASEGIKRLLCPEKVTLTDVFTGEVLPGNECFVDVKLNFGETRLVEIK